MRRANRAVRSLGLHNALPSYKSLGPLTVGWELPAGSGDQPHYRSTAGRKASYLFGVALLSISAMRAIESLKYVSLASNPR